MISSQNVMLLFKWKGSLWKNVWKECIMYTFVYFLITIFYRVILTPAENPLPTAAPLTNHTNESLTSDAQAVVQLIAEEGPQEWFTRFIGFFESYAQGMPITFILGFYVSL